MPEIIKTYVRTVEATNRAVGKFAMYLIFAMMGILLLSSISRSVFDLNFIWIVEMAQFTMASYYILGGGYSIILKGHVRMDLLYGKWTEKGRAIADVLTSFFLIFYLVLLLYGAICIRIRTKELLFLGASHGSDQNNHDHWDCTDAAPGSCCFI